MAFASYTPKGELAKMLRKRAGKYIKERREDLKMTQVQLADRVGIKYFTFVSQVERGDTRVPPESLHKWAAALDLPIAEFSKKLLSYYDPYTYAAIFTEPVTKRGAPAVLVDGEPLGDIDET